MKLKPYPIKYIYSDQQGEGYLQKKFAKLIREQEKAAQQDRVVTAPLEKGSAIPAAAAPPIPISRRRRA